MKIKKVVVSNSMLTKTYSEAIVLSSLSLFWTLYDFIFVYEKYNYNVNEEIKQLHLFQCMIILFFPILMLYQGRAFHVKCSKYMYTNMYTDSINIQFIHTNAYI